MSTADPTASDARRSHGLVLAITGVAVVAGAVLRFVTSSPLWLDEALSANVADLPLGDIPAALRRDGHPIGFYALLKGWSGVVGEGDSALRALSGVASLLTIPAIWLVARRTQDATTAGFTIAVAAALPFLIRYGTEARMYSLVALVVALAWWAVDAAREEGRMVHLAAVAASTAALLHLHYWSFFLLATAGLWLLVVAAGRTGGDARSAQRVLAAAAVGGLTFVPWLPVFVDQLRNTGTPWATTARPAEIVLEATEGLGGGVRFEPRFFGLLVTVLAVLGAFAVRRDSSTVELDVRAPAGARIPAVMTAGTLALGGVAAIVTGAGFEMRYVAVVVPFLVVLIARGIAALPRPASVVMLALVVGLGLAAGAYESSQDRSQGEEIAAAIDAAAGPDDTVLWCPDQLGPSTSRYLGHDGELVTYPRGTAPDRVDWHDYLHAIASVDPAAFAADLDDRVTGSIWVVSFGTYRGFEGRCEAIVNELTAARGQSAVVVAPRDLFEPAALRRFGPPS